MKSETEKLVNEVMLGVGIGSLIVAGVFLAVDFPSVPTVAKVAKPRPTVICVTKVEAPVVAPVAKRQPVRVVEEPEEVYVGVTDELLDGIVMKESGGNPNAIGDRHLRHKAYWLLQIRKPYLDDVNRKIVGRKAMSRIWGKPALTLADMKDPTKARWVARTYLEYYGEQYRRRTGRVPTYEVYARMHNGGPDGWRERATRKYWRDVAKAIERARCTVAMVARSAEGEDA